MKYNGAIRKYEIPQFSENWIELDSIMVTKSERKEQISDKFIIHSMKKESKGIYNME